MGVGWPDRRGTEAGDGEPVPSGRKGVVLMEEVGKWPGGLKAETTSRGGQETEERKASERGSQHVEQLPMKM